MFVPNVTTRFQIQKSTVLSYNHVIQLIKQYNFAYPSRLAIQVV